MEKKDKGDVTGLDESVVAPSVRDERTVSGKHHVLGLLGPGSSSFTLAWLASHRGRLRTFIAGGKRLTVMVIWDTKGAALVPRTDADEDAVRQIVYGDRP